MWKVTLRVDTYFLKLQSNEVNDIPGEQKQTKRFQYWSSSSLK